MVPKDVLNKPTKLTKNYKKSSYSCLSCWHMGKTQHGWGGDNCAGNKKGMALRPKVKVLFDSGYNVEKKRRKVLEPNKYYWYSL